MLPLDIIETIYLYLPFASFIKLLILNKSLYNRVTTSIFIARYVKLHQVKDFTTDKSITYSFLINEGYLYLLTPIEAQLSLLWKLHKYLNASSKKRLLFNIYFDEITGSRSLVISISGNNFRFLGYVGHALKNDNLSRPTLNYDEEYNIIKFYTIMKPLFIQFPKLWGSNIDANGWAHIRQMIL
jgi:hypothetical protein